MSRAATSPSKRGGGRDETINSPFSQPNLSAKRVDILGGRYESEAERDYQRRQVDLLTLRGV
jgi:hypothetical protein